MTGFKSVCCGAPIFASNVVTETGLAADICFTPSSKLFCGKCKAVTDEHPSATAPEAGPIPAQPEDVADPGPVPEPAEPLDAGRTWLAIVKRVIDADTLEVTFDLGFRVFHTTRLRIANCDAAEIGTPAGDMAKAELEKEITGRTLKITTYQTRDKYGRTLASVELPSGVDLANWITAHGFNK
jgi:endonuclease YncB( thermonuclease family)